MGCVLRVCGRKSLHNGVMENIAVLCHCAECLLCFSGPNRLYNVAELKVPQLLNFLSALASVGTSGRAGAVMVG